MSYKWKTNLWSIITVLYYNKYCIITRWASSFISAFSQKQIVNPDTWSMMHITISIIKSTAKILRMDNWELFVDQKCVGQQIWTINLAIWPAGTPHYYLPSWLSWGGIPSRRPWASVWSSARSEHRLHIRCGIHPNIKKKDWINSTAKGYTC